jgi:hypothetical protein
MYQDINAQTARAWAMAKLKSNGKPRYTAYVEHDGEEWYMQEEELVVSYINSMGYSVDLWYDTAYRALSNIITKLDKYAKELTDKGIVPEE